MPYENCSNRNRSNGALSIPVFLRKENIYSAPSYAEALGRLGSLQARGKKQTKPHWACAASTLLTRHWSSGPPHFKVYAFPLPHTGSFTAAGSLHSIRHPSSHPLLLTRIRECQTEPGKASSPCTQKDLEAWR